MVGTYELTVRVGLNHRQYENEDQQQESSCSLHGQTSRPYTIGSTDLTVLEVFHICSKLALVFHICSKLALVFHMCSKLAWDSGPRLVRKIPNKCNGVGM